MIEHGGFFPCGHKGKCYINGAYLKAQDHLKRVVVSQDIEGFVTVVLNIGKALIPRVWMLRIVHVQDVHSHHVDDLYMSIILGVEGSLFHDLGVHW